MTAIEPSSTFVPISLQLDVIVVHRSSEIRNTMYAMIRLTSCKPSQYFFRQEQIPCDPLEAVLFLHMNMVDLSVLRRGPRQTEQNARLNEFSYDYKICVVRDETVEEIRVHGMSRPLYVSVESGVFVSGVVYSADSSVRFHQHVVTLDFVAISFLMLFLDVTTCKLGLMSLKTNIFRYGTYNLSYNELNLYSNFHRNRFSHYRVKRFEGTILRKRMRFHPCLLQLLQALKPEDKVLRRNFCTSMQTLIGNDDEFIRSVVFSDDVTFQLSELLQLLISHRCKLGTYKVVRIEKNISQLELIYPVTGHSFLPSDRVFGLIERELRKIETITTKEDYYAIFKKYGTLKLIGSDWKAVAKRCMTSASQLPLADV
ncbi:hypothetical protein ANN_03371 [Periplaneta americana]|uniref:Uncharacterized protein n=1 Tax=Periplaneta americana TaxID=6978 RepID=A0ABQ8U1Q7_PERAM|nr:hypothetical protein ANN_03371 [Periplaneta americana]